jgi:hypothetical protein
MSGANLFERKALCWTGGVFLNTATNICFWMISGFFFMTAFNAHATTVNYALDNVILAGGEPITGTFDWTFSVDDFEGGSGTFTVLDIPHTTFYTFDIGNLNIDIQTSAIEVSGDGSFHDAGLDISMKFLQPFTATQSAPIDTDPNQSFFECCGNGFEDQPFQSGRIIPSTFLVGDFDADGDTDGADFLKWQRSEVSNPPSASDLVAWEANYGAPTAAASAAVPEPSSLALLCLGGLLALRSSRHVTAFTA